jgi:hypothetical protein
MNKHVTCMTKSLGKWLSSSLLMQNHFASKTILRNP